MSDTIVLTSIYSEFWGTKEFRKSCEMVGLPIHNAFKGKRFTGNGDVLKMLYDALLELKGKYKYVIYSDGADTFFQNPFTPPSDYMIISAEKNCYPDKGKASKYGMTLSPWCFVNGGGWCGPIDIVINFFEKYGLNKFKGDVNGQRELTDAYLAAKQDDFPILLDQMCGYFQTTAFEDPGDFRLAQDGKRIENCITGTFPSVLHGNGRTDMTPIYKRFNLQ